MSIRLFRWVPFAAGVVAISLQKLVMYALLFALPVALIDLLRSAPRRSDSW